MKELLRNKPIFITLVILLLLILSWFTIYSFRENSAGPILVQNNISNHNIIDEPQKLFLYGEVVNSCNEYFEQDCVNMRTDPDLNSEIVVRLRNNIVLKLGEKIENDSGVWYEIIFDEWLRYPERTRIKNYVSAQYLKIFLDEGSQELVDGTTSSSTKFIIVDRSEQMLYAYEGDKVFMKEKISTGIELTPTPRGVFTVYKKTPTRYMQGPIPEISDKEYDLPGVPWNLYFTKEGAVIHGAYWHNKFGQVWSNGCVNLPPEKAKELYNWADLGIKIIVRD